ncbi:fatty acyl-AMP ligase [Nocardia brasiliensis]|uniref:Long-chain-fatty-acid--(Acyl-carrier-protein) ligase n=1 Tax=Nocardia brasiliensis (strain ATCC 700358 / HUJEG-1) TaxID=1133849 RepID=K0ENP9_NOCB7|nr:fatty acyl-AMP ligase [Nocardia brasiliensis]AFU01238.1 long-chain-fatty-acid--(acyl-carrier-protein) ligase [Nocardia brasiliensis ATCC 700358]OCF86596.1 AMP-dependent synthetase [Nocardia brasiliensis]
MNSAESVETLHGALAEIAAGHPGVSATFWSVSETVDYAELDRRARAAAAALVRHGITRGEPVGILCPNAPEFLVSLFGIAAAGGAATPLPLPAGTRQLDGYPRKLAAIVAAAGMRTILVSPRFADLTALLGSAVDVELLDTATLFAADGDEELPELTSDDLAIVQFTSGSTATPKGVRLTHRNVLSGLAAIRTGIALSLDDRGGFWLPLFHDMGLFGTLSAILRGIPAHVWSPVAFVKDPARWLAEFAASGTTITAMPNFGYEALLAAVPPEQVAEFDLRHWRIAFNGSEPISLDVVGAFCARFAPAGFATSTMFGVYGMAEATLAVAFPPLGRAPVFDWVDRAALSDDALAQQVSSRAPGARAVASVGSAVAGLRLRIVDPAGDRELPDGVVGEILIQGPSVTDGYLTAAPETVAGLHTADGWLRTGDLGYLRDGELFVTGRCKDMITVRGVNYYAQDVEAAVHDLDGVYKGRCTAAIDPDGTDVIALIAETELTGPAADALGDRIRARVAARLGLAAVDVYLVAPRTIPRTSSGKLQRLAARGLITATR